MALNVAAVAPAATVTDVGTVSQLEFLVSVTFDPPAGAAVLKVTVQVLTSFGRRLAGLQVRPESVPAGIIEPPPEDVMLSPFPLGSVPVRFDI